MEAGRELDKLVAEKVMGVPFVPYDSLLTSYPAKNVYATPPYSTDIAAAWLVVERMHKHPKPVLMLVAPQQDYVNEKWRACFSRKWWNSDEPYSWEASADTAPHAICLAALIWGEAWSKEKAQA